MPDFPNGGMADFSGYNDGLRGSRVRVRAKIKKLDNKTLIIYEIPFGTTTGSLIESVIKANDKGKIKIKKIEDNTSMEAEIIVHLFPGVSPDKTIDALYAFTDCEVSISPNSTIIDGDKPRFMGVSEILKVTADTTVRLLKLELEIRLDELERMWHFSTLEKLFINNEMYIDFKLYSDKETLYEYLYKRFSVFKKELLREITDEDLHKLTQIPMIRITRFDASKADDALLKIEEEMLLEHGVQAHHGVENLDLVAEGRLLHLLEGILDHVMMRTRTGDADPGVIDLEDLRIGFILDRETRIAKRGEAVGGNRDLAVFSGNGNGSHELIECPAELRATG